MRLFQKRCRVPKLLDSLELEIIKDTIESSLNWMATIDISSRKLHKGMFLSFCSVRKF